MFVLIWTWCCGHIDELMRLFLELIEHENNGLVCEPTPEALAECFDRLYENRNLAREMGRRAEERVRELNITWDHVVEQLLS